MKWLSLFSLTGRELPSLKNNFLYIYTFYKVLKISGPSAPLPEAPGQIHKLVDIFTEPQGGDKQAWQEAAIPSGQGKSQEKLVLIFKFFKRL